MSATTQAAPQGQTCAPVHPCEQSELCQHLLPSVRRVLQTPATATNGTPGPVAPQVAPTHSWLEAQSLSV